MIKHKSRSPKIVFLFLIFFVLAGCGKKGIPNSPEPLTLNNTRREDVKATNTIKVSYSGDPNITPSDKNDRIKNLFTKYEALNQYRVEYWISVASEEKNYYGQGNDEYNTETGQGLPQIIYKKNDDYKIHYEKWSALMLDDDPITNLDEYWLDGVSYTCGDDNCKNEGQKDKSWDWTIFRNPNFFYDFLKDSSRYETEYLGEEQHNLKRIAEHFKIKILDPIKIKNINFITEQKERKAEVDLLLDKETGIVLSLRISAQSDATESDSEKLYELITWNASSWQEITNESDLALPGKFNLLKEARDKNSIFLLLEPYVSFTASGIMKIFPSSSQGEEAIPFEIPLASRKYEAGKREKFIVDPGMPLPQSVKYEFCVSDACKTIANFSSVSLQCLKNSLDNDNCQKNESCLYTENQECVDLDCSLLKDENSCQTHECYWNDTDPQYARCMDYQCKFYTNEMACQANSSCVWRSDYCYDKFCSDIHTQEECAISPLGCEWQGAFCSK